MVFSYGKVILPHWMLLAARLWLGGTFVISGWSKFPHFNEFQRALYDYHLFPVPVATVISHIIPGLELLLGIYLMVGLFLRPASAITSLLLLGFIGVLSYALFNGLSVDCGCYVGGKSQPVTWWKVAEDLGLLLLAGAIFSNNSQRYTLDAVFKKSPPRPSR
ncbi:MAG: MauE/DoxX family redox-associated membrane protein [Vampirovibrionales bacterium]